MKVENDLYQPTPSLHFNVNIWYNQIFIYFRGLCTIWYWYVRPLCQISKQLYKWNGCYGRTRICEIWVYYEFRTDILYYTAPSLWSTINSVCYILYIPSPQPAEKIMLIWTSDTQVNWLLTHISLSFLQQFDYDDKLSDWNHDVYETITNQWIYYIQCNVFCFGWSYTYM